MANSCHTPDAAYALLYAQKLDMQVKLASSAGKMLERQAKIEKASATIHNEKAKNYLKLKAQAEIKKLEAESHVFYMNIEGAKKELATIEKLMAELEPQRKYAHLSILDANEACQREELLLEMKFRAENYILSQGSIPADHLSTMRCHPDFLNQILPHIQKLTQLLHETKDMKATFESVTNSPLLSNEQKYISSV
jgi:hypothetical protein